MYNLGYLFTPSEKTAIIFDREYSYSELDNLANGFALGLAGYKRVGILADNSINFIAAYLGILRAGATAVLISTKLPQLVCEYVIKDSQCDVVLTDANFFNFFKTGTVVQVSVNENDPALILYTSGSTKMPKGVVIPHSHLWTINQKAKNPLLPKVRMLVAAPCYHMNGLSNVEVGLAGNATIVLMNQFDAKTAVQSIKQHGVNYISSVPTMIALLLQEDVTELTTVKHIAMASAPVSKELYSSIKQSFPRVTVSIAYGSTEAGPGLFGRHPTLSTPEMSVGYPATGIDYRLSDGILEIKSPSMMSSYSNGDSRFTQDGYFITNDIFETDDAGFYYFVGRADDMFVSGGNNIYPRKIETILESYPGVIESAVVPLEDAIKGVKPYAFVTVNANTTETAIKAHILKTLSYNECPRKIWIIDSMPLTGVNKIDKNKLIEQARIYTA